MTFSYKRSNHFAEWLNRFQSLDITEIPTEIYNEIEKEIEQKIEPEIYKEIEKEIEKDKILLQDILTDYVYEEGVSNFIIYYKNQMKYKEIRKDLITRDIVRNALRETQNNKYYDYIFYIINKLKGISSPRLSEEVKEIIKQMFNEIQEPFSRIREQNTTSFFSYSYVIRKLLELLNQYECIQYFPLLKSREKVYQQDMLWKQVCKDLNWDFIPSV